MTCNEGTKYTSKLSTRAHQATYFAVGRVVLAGAGSSKARSLAWKVFASGCLPCTGLSACAREPRPLTAGMIPGRCCGSLLLPLLLLMPAPRAWTGGRLWLLLLAAIDACAGCSAFLCLEAAVGFQLAALLTLYWPRTPPPSISRA